MGLLSGVRLLAVDTETTGMSPAAGDRLVEVAWVEIVDGALGAEWSSLVRPGRPIPEGATRVHGITDAIVAGAPGPREVGLALREACGDLPLVFHNAPFDLPFLIQLFREAGAPALLNPIVDTLGLARGLSGSGGNSLGALASRMGLPAETAHRALGDARTTARLFLALVAEWEKPGGAGSGAVIGDFRRGARTLSGLAAASQDVMRATARR